MVRVLHWRHAHWVKSSIPSSFIIFLGSERLLLLKILLLMLKKHLLRPKWLIVTGIVVITIVFAVIIKEKIILRIVVIAHKHWLEERRLMYEGVRLAKV